MPPRWGVALPILPVGGRSTEALPRVGGKAQTEIRCFSKSFCLSPSRHTLKCLQEWPSLPRLPLLLSNGFRSLQVSSFVASWPGHTLQPFESISVHAHPDTHVCTK